MEEGEHQPELARREIERGKATEQPELSEQPTDGDPLLAFFPEAALPCEHLQAVFGLHPGSRGP
jgi:hypothetical protein